MGIQVNIYKRGGEEAYAVKVNGAGYEKGFTVINAEGDFEPSEEYPAAELVMEEPIGGRKVLRLIPVSKKGKWTMFGGKYAATSDSRFGELCEKLLGATFYGAVAVHDFTE